MQHLPYQQKRYVQNSQHRPTDLPSGARQQVPDAGSRTAAGKHTASHHSDFLFSWLRFPLWFQPAFSKTLRSFPPRVPKRTPEFPCRRYLSLWQGNFAYIAQFPARNDWYISCFNGIKDIFGLLEGHSMSIRSACANPYINYFRRYKICKCHPFPP